jgi:ferritin
MLKEKVAKVLNDQVNAEYYSAYLYLFMSAWADNAGFKGAANWLRIQAREEMTHGIRIYEYLLGRGHLPSFADIKAPQEDFSSIQDIFAKVLSHEKYVSELINNIASIARKEDDHASYNFIAWYVNEQVEEECSAAEIFAKVKLAADNPGALYLLDAELASRTFAESSPS